ncbi:MAG: histidine--tRNA ligase [Stellaceae bacterium]
MRTLQPVRGTQDLLPETARRHRRVSETARALAELCGFAEMATPIFEFTEVFSRPIGETSDIVTKEMYSFVDRGGEEITLRPENTAGVVRALLSNGLIQSTPLKFFYSGPMFRYERPQKGRLRQFHQIGVELIGVAQPQADIEVIALGSRILDALGVRQNTVLELNTLGDPESRAAYREALVAHFSARLSELSEDSRRRLERNPLRIFDSKEETDRRVSVEAPAFDKFLNAVSRDFFAQVRDGLDRLGIPYRLNPRLVRGLDYYSHTAFEFVTSDLGAQGTVIGGGRYDGLVEMMGGAATPGVGWAGGIERLAMLIPEPPSPRRPIAVVPIGEAAEAAALTLAEVLRSNDCAVDLSYSGNLVRRMRRANRINARAAVLIGEDEIARHVVALRDLDSGEQVEVPMDLSLSELRARLQALYS